MTHPAPLFLTPHPSPYHPPRSFRGPWRNAMARHTEGYVKSYRSIWDSDISDNPICLAIWTTLLHLARWRPGSTNWQGEQRELPPGSVIFGIKELADRWKCSRTTIKHWLNYLVRSDRISIETCTKGTLVTIKNWATYQGDDAVDRQQGDIQLSSGCHPSDIGLALKEEVQTGKKERREEPFPPKPSAQAVTGPTWEAYREAYRNRYGTDPTRNGSVNGKLAQFVKRLGARDSPLVAAFFLTHNDAFYVRTKHQVGIMLRDAEKLHAEWKTGNRSTAAQAAQVDRLQNNATVLADAFREVRERRSGNGAA